MQNTSNLNVKGTEPLITPADLLKKRPMTDSANDTVVTGRQTVQDILDGKDTRLLCVVGPCSIHDTGAALDYADRLKELADRLSDQLFFVMRVYFEKPRTTVGWKGLINDPDLNGTCKIQKGLELARQLLIDINEKGLPTGTEMLDPITPQYIADLISWSAIGARTTESQTHREMASGLSMPVGFKNGTTGDLNVAINAMKSAKEPHNFLGIDPYSRVSIIQTAGNGYGHVVLRGGGGKTNYDEESVRIAEESLRSNNLRTAVMIDCSHANSHKNHEKQMDVLSDITKQIVNGNQSIIGVMMESHINAGNQKHPSELPLQYGVSITDKCLDWERTKTTFTQTHEKLKNKPQ